MILIFVVVTFVIILCGYTVWCPGDTRTRPVSVNTQNNIMNNES